MISLITFLFLPYSEIVIAGGPQLYGKANISIAALEDSAGNAIVMDSNTSFIGVKGTIDAEKLTITYKYELGINITDNSKSSEDHIVGYNQYVGLKNELGEIRIGRHDTIFTTN